MFLTQPSSSGVKGPREFQGRKGPEPASGYQMVRNQHKFIHLDDHRDAAQRNICPGNKKEQEQLTSPPSPRLPKLSA